MEYTLHIYVFNPSIYVYTLISHILLTVCLYTKCYSSLFQSSVWHNNSKCFCVVNVTFPQAVPRKCENSITWPAYFAVPHPGNANKVHWTYISFTWLYRHIRWAILFKANEFQMRFNLIVFLYFHAIVSNHLKFKYFSIWLN